MLDIMLSYIINNAQKSILILLSAFLPSLFLVLSFPSDELFPIILFLIGSQLIICLAYEFKKKEEEVKINKIIYYYLTSNEIYNNKLKSEFLIYLFISIVCGAVSLLVGYYDGIIVLLSLVLFAYIVVLLNQSKIHDTLSRLIQVFTIIALLANLIVYKSLIVMIVIGVILIILIGSHYVARK